MRIQRRSGLFCGLSSGLVSGLFFILTVLAPVSPAGAQEAPAGAQDKPGPAAAPAVAVLYFDYDGSSEEMGFLRKGLAQMLVTDLAAVPQVKVVERARLQDVLDELELGRSRKIDAHTASRIGKLLGARYLVMGGYFDIGGTLRVDARVVEVETGTVVASVGGHRKTAEFLALEQHLAGALGTALGKLKPVRAARSGKPGRRGKHGGAGGSTARAPRAPAALDARQAATYGKALDAMDRGDTGAARAILQGLMKEQPDFEMASLDLAALAR